MRLPRPFVQILTAIASLVAVPFAHGTSGDSTPFLLDTRNFADSTPLFAVDSRAPDLIANTGITDLGGSPFTITMAMLQVTGGGTITFTLVTGPVHGTLLLNGIAQGVGATFTQAQIDAGLLSYLRGAGDPLSDTFEVAVMDDDAGLLGGNLTFAVSGISGASGGLTLVDTRNYTDSGDSTVHTDNRAYVPADTVPGSLRQAIANAAAGETVDFDAGLSGGTITLGGAQLAIAKDFTIDGTALDAAVTVSGNNASRVFDIGDFSTVAIDGLTIADGAVTAGALGGGGILVRTGSELTLTGGTIRDSRSGDFGGGLMNRGSLEVSGMTFANNTSDNLGAGLANNGALTVRGSTFSGNHAANLGGGIFTEQHVALIENTTVSGNTTGTSSGAGVWSQGAGGALTLRHVTVAGNTGNTVANNFSGAGVLNFSPATVTLENTIIADNVTGSGAISDLESNVTTLGANLVETHYGSVLSGPALITSDPVFAPLGDYGGPTQTMALRAGSPAIDAAGATALATDQRGFARSVGGAPDIGTYESGNAAGYAAWAAEMIAEGLDASFTDDAEEDDSPNGNEYALGTRVLISDPGSANNPTMLTNGSGEVEITFGLNAAAAVDTRWIIKRSIDLVNFAEIYRYDGPTETSTQAAGVTAAVGASSITVTDENPPAPRAFYKFEAEQL